MLTYILSRTVSKSLQIIVKITLAFDKGTYFNTLVRGEPLNARLRNSASINDRKLETLSYVQKEFQYLEPFRRGSWM